MISIPHCCGKVREQSLKYAADKKSKIKQERRRKVLQNLIESKYIGEQEKWDASVEQKKKKQSWKGQQSTERKVKF